MPSAPTSAHVSMTGSFSEGSSTQALTHLMHHTVPNVPALPTEWTLSNADEARFAASSDHRPSDTTTPSSSESRQAETTIEDLQLEMDRMTRVYSDLQRVNQHRSDTGRVHLRFSELLSANRSNDSTSTLKAFGGSDHLEKVQQKIENDLLRSPNISEYNQKSLPHISRMQKFARPVTPEPEGICSDQLATSLFHPSLTRQDSHVRSDYKRPLSSTSVTRSPRQRSSKLPPSKPPIATNKKRYSILSQYNPYPTPESSPRLSSAQWGPFPSVRDSLGRSQDNYNFIFPAQPADTKSIHQEVTMPSVTSTRMDTAIDAFNFTTPTRHELDALSNSRQDEKTFPLFTDLQWGTDLEETMSQYERRTRSGIKSTA